MVSMRKDIPPRKERPESSKNSRTMLSSFRILAPDELTVFVLACPASSSVGVVHVSTALIKILAAERGARPVSWGSARFWEGPVWVLPHFGGGLSSFHLNTMTTMASLGACLPARSHQHRSTCLCNKAQMPRRRTSGGCLPPCRRDSAESCNRGWTATSWRRSAAPARLVLRREGVGRRIVMGGCEPSSGSVVGVLRCDAARGNDMEGRRRRGVVRVGDDTRRASSFLVATGRASACGKDAGEVPIRTRHDGAAGRGRACGCQSTRTRGGQSWGPCRG